MTLCIVFGHETIPFILSGATEEECLQAIEKAKENFVFDKQSATVRDDYIFLHAWHKQDKQTAKKKKRLYCLGDKIILQTDWLYKDEIESTRELLAYEKNVNPNKIYVVEV